MPTRDRRVQAPTTPRIVKSQLRLVFRPNRRANRSSAASMAAALLPVADHVSSARMPSTSLRVDRPATAEWVPVTAQDAGPAWTADGARPAAASGTPLVPPGSAPAAGATAATTPHTSDTATR